MNTKIFHSLNMFTILFSHDTFSNLFLSAFFGIKEKHDFHFCHVNSKIDFIKPPCYQLKIHIAFNFSEVTYFVKEG